MGINEAGQIVLRASSVRSFHETPDVWYKQHILGEDKFEGNTATYLGTVIHLFAETYFSGEAFDPMMVLEDAPEFVEQDIILAEYKDMCDVLEKGYLSCIEPPDHLELFSKVELDNVVFQGTCDSVNDGHVLVDYKSSKTPKKKIDEYVQQLNIYAFMMKQVHNIDIDTLRVVNISRKTKTLPPRLTVIECPADLEMGKYLIELMVDKTNLATRNTEFRDLIFGSNPYSFLSDGFTVEQKIIDFGGDDG